MNAIVAEARNWVGVRYCHQGRVRAGVDCIGLVGVVAAALGVAEAIKWAADPEGRGYGREPDPALLARLCGRYLEPIGSPCVGAILLLVVPPVKSPRHFAIVSALDPVTIVHAYAVARRVVETRLPESMAIAGVFRYR